MGDMSSEISYLLGIPLLSMSCSMPQYGIQIVQVNRHSTNLLKLFYRRRSEPTSGKKHVMNLSSHTLGG